MVSASPLTAHYLFKTLAGDCAESVQMGLFVVMASSGSFVHALDCYYAITINDLDYYYY